jgi:hypothetical protein
MNDYYEKKSIKYKYKYLKLKNELYGGNDNAEYLYHGTTLFYIEHIMKNGLGGFQNELFDDIEKYWKIIKEFITDTGAIAHVPMFIDRYQEYKTYKKYISISFTTNLSVAREFGGGVRLLGEGIKYFLCGLEEFLNKELYKGDEILEYMKEDMEKLHVKLKDGAKYPGLILAIKISDFTDQLKKWLIKTPIKKNLYEIPLYFLIEPNKLYIIPEDKDEDIIKLISDEGKIYVDKKLEKLNNLYKLKSEWTQDKNLTGNIKYIMLKNDEYFIQIRYDRIYKNILLQLIDLNKLNGTIIDIVFSLITNETVEKQFYKNKITDELKNKINISITEMIYNTGENRNKYYEIFKEFKKKSMD